MYSVLMMYSGLRFVFSCAKRRPVEAYCLEGYMELCPRSKTPWERP